MPDLIEENVSHLLALMAESGQTGFSGQWLQERSGLDPRAVSGAVEYLGDLGAVRVIRSRSSGPFSFRDVSLQPRGRFLYQAIQAQRTEAAGSAVERFLPERLRNPIASPYGFTVDDWATVASRKEDPQTLYVVLALQFVSIHYNMRALIGNVQSRFRGAVQQYNERHQDAMITVHFEHLLAGLKKHLFHRIARDIIGADIAVFETSDWNPDVMVEMGAALTWGVPVLPLRRTSARPAVSDVSGQTYVLHEDSAARILCEEFDSQLVSMIEQAIQVKARA